MDRILDTYVDGSYRQVSSWSFVIIDKGTVLHESSGVLTGDINKHRQIGGEMESVKKALDYAIHNQFKIRVFYDYIGLYKWVADIWNEPIWRAKTHYTKVYRDYVLKRADFLHSMVKVKSHSGEKWNEYVDRLASKTLSSWMSNHRKDQKLVDKINELNSPEFRSRVDEIKRLMKWGKYATV